MYRKSLTQARGLLTLMFLSALAGPALAATSSQYANAWVSSGTDWTPSSPNSNPLGPPDSNCTGTSNAGTVFAEFSFPSFGIPGGDTVVGIEVNVNYGSVVSPTMQLKLSGSNVGSTRPLPVTPPAGSCNASVIRTAGGPMDTWGAGLTAADVNSGNLAVRLTRTTGPDEPRSIDIESVQMVIYHQGANSPPTAVCQNVTKSANASCQASVAASEVNNGSSDPDGDTLSFSLSPAGPFGLGVTNVTLTVDDGNGGMDSCAATVTVVDDTNPMIFCPADASLNASADSCQATYAGPPATATDNCPGVGVSASPALPALLSGAGDHAITYTATDGSGNMAMCSQTVTVVDVTAPVITLNGDDPVTLECAVDSYTEAGASAVDNCDGPVGVTPSGAVDEGTPGTYEIDYTASDAAGNTAEETRTVVVEDTLAPEITVSGDRFVLWPPNHKYHTIDLVDVVTDASDLCDLTLSADDVVIAAVSSDEDENASGDGNTVDDIVIASDCRTVDLRAERQGGGNGRVYTLDLEVTDASDNLGTASSQVEVPHDKQDTAVDDGPAYSEVSDCASFKAQAECGRTLDKAGGPFQGLIEAKSQCMAADW